MIFSRNILFSVMVTLGDGTPGLFKTADSHAFVLGCLKTIFLSVSQRQSISLRAAPPPRPYNKIVSYVAGSEINLE